MYNPIQLLVGLLFVSFAAAKLSKTSLILYDSTYYNLEAGVDNNNDSISTLSSELLQFIQDLNVKSDVVYDTYDSENVSLFYDDKIRYDNLILLPNSKKALGSKANLNQHQLLKYLNNNGNILIVGSIESVLPESFRIFLNELGIYPSPKNYKLIDHNNPGKHSQSVKLNDDNIKNHKLIPHLDLDYQGSSCLISNNELIFPIIKSSKTSITCLKSAKNAESNNVWGFGELNYPAVGLQALNNARLLWIGSPQLLLPNLTNWVFQHQGQLKLQFVEHINTESPWIINPTLYRIKDQLIYTIGVSELIDNEWKPYEISNQQDSLQLSFKMLDPYQRLDLKPLGPVSFQDNDILDTFVYYINFTLPDHHGMFTFELDYKRYGLSYLQDKRVVTVRHLANDEYKRSWDITNAWLYVASAGIVVISWFLFVINYIYVTKVDENKKNI